MSSGGSATCPDEFDTSQAERVAAIESRAKEQAFIFIEGTVGLVPIPATAIPETHKEFTECLFRVPAIKAPFKKSLRRTMKDGCLSAPHRAEQKSKPVNLLTLKWPSLILAVWQNLLWNSSETLCFALERFKM